MKILQVIGASANFASGVLSLSGKQAKAREHALRDLGDGLFEVLEPVCFKRGEMFGFDGDMPKALALCLEALEPEPEIEPETEEAGETEEAIETLDIDLEDMDREELLSFAKAIGLNPHPNTGKPRLLEVIKERQDVMLAEQEAAREEA